MADTWDMSFLVDQATQIQEARGSLAKHFGMLQQVLIGKHLVNFVGGEDRLPFLRMMGRLSQRNWTERVAFRFRTPLSGELRMALQARPGSGPMAWWLMVSESGAADLPLIGEAADSGDKLASESEFSVLAQGAVSDAEKRLDVSVFRAAILADNQPHRALSQEKSVALEQRIGATLQESAAGGLVSRPEPGQFALMHDKQVSSQSIAERIAATATAAGVSARDLGLSHTTQPMPADPSADAISELVRTMRSTLGERAARKPGLLDTLKQMVGVR